MKINLKHLKERRMSYVSHFFFATSVAARLAVSSVFLFVHSVLPWFEFSRFDIETTIAYLKDKHDR